MPAITFKIKAKDTKTRARVASLETPHGVIETPAFVTVGTLASVRTLTPDEIRAAGSQIVLANTYHLYLEGRHEVIQKAGGLAKFMNWNGPTMTDSGGYQVFSMGFGSDQGIGKNIPFFPGADAISDLAQGKREALVSSEAEEPKNLKITEEGATFSSPRNGDKIELTPEKSVVIQEGIGADIFFAFDECTSPLSSYEYTKEAVGRTARWARRCIETKTRNDQAIFGVIQGGLWRDLREKSTAEIVELPFDGYGLGGPVGMSREDITKIVGWMTARLPEEKPRHLLGMGSPREILDVIAEGVDLFDCVIPTREARNGTLYTSEGRVHIENAQFREDFSPLDQECSCILCAQFTKAYLHHLFRGGELLAKRLATIHNLTFINGLVRQAREAIKSGSFTDFHRAFRDKNVY